MDMFRNLLGSNGSGIPDTVKLVVLGGAVETARRVTGGAWNSFVDSFFLSAHFSSEDYPYDWLLHWLSKQPAWGRSREFEITTRSRNGRWSQPTTGDLEEEEDEDDELVHGRKKRCVAFMPSHDTTHTIFFNGHCLRITRAKRLSDYGHCDELKVSVVARNNNIIKQLVLEAKKTYEKDAEHRVHIFLADTYGSWRWTGSKQKRPLSSIVLEPSVKDMLLADCRDFIRSEEWYAERGIPYRRGYLLHGVPGSGKTSLIHSLAGELGLDIYVVSLSSKGMSDNTLTTLMGNVPSRCILLLEDLDAAFTRGVTRDESSTGTPTSTSTTSTTKSSSTTTDDGSTLSLSGLLNALDGVAAAEGRLLFATTNHIERLDPALSRPGRCDVWVNFTNASRWQAEGLYKCFFPSSKPKVDEGVKPEPDVPISETNIPVPRRKKFVSTVIRLPADEIDALLSASLKAFRTTSLASQVFKVSFSRYDPLVDCQAFQLTLWKNKTRPRECVDEVAAWVVKERETKAKLKKEKEEKEAKEKKEAAEEKAKKEAEEKAAALVAAAATETKTAEAATTTPVTATTTATVPSTEIPSEVTKTESTTEPSSAIATPGDSDVEDNASSSPAVGSPGTSVEEKWVPVKPEEAAGAA